VKLVSATLNSAYKWPSEKNDEHHLFWPNAWYANDPNTPVNPHVFRNEDFNKTDWPRTFHNWTHKTTIPAEPPSMEVMEFATMAHGGIDDMAHATQTSMRLLRNKQISHVRFTKRMDELFDQYHAGLDRIRSLPEEFHFIDTEKYDVSNMVDMLEMRGELGMLAAKRTVAVTTRIIRQDTYADTKEESEELQKVAI
jgi:hypothetical protein